MWDQIGEEAVEELVRYFYSRIPDDPILGPMYPEDDWEGAEKRLRDFLIFRFGGPDRYIQERGHPALRMRHAPFTINQAARDRWMEIMSEAIEKSKLAPEVASVIHEFLGDVATFLINRPQ